MEPYDATPSTLHPPHIMIEQVVRPRSKSSVPNHPAQSNIRQATPKTVPSRPAMTEAYQKEVLEDYRICCLSREVSILSRREVLNGRANFGIIGDGKELAQVAMAKAWRKGDFRSGYYRDQTLIMALGLTTIEEMFAQLYGDPANDPFSRGRQMNCHFATAFVEEDGRFTVQKERYNSSSDIAPTAGQMARAMGYAFASKKFRELPHLSGQFSENGNEVCFCTIGDASTSEGAFWETVNAAGVLQVPLAISVWDDGYGISVPKKYQTTKESISEVLKGFEGEKGIRIYKAKAWDYEELCTLYTEAIEEMRETHQPALFHIEEVTQQLGHSTSGDHRRYKDAARLAFEEAYDCNKRFADWIVEQRIATTEQLEAIQVQAKHEVQEAAQTAYNRYNAGVRQFRDELNAHLQALQVAHPENKTRLEAIQRDMAQMRNPLRHEILIIGRRTLLALSKQNSHAKEEFAAFLENERRQAASDYGQHLYSESPSSPLRVPVIPAHYSDDAPYKDGFEVLNACFDYNLAHYPNLFAFGEDVGHIGDVNQGLRGMQQKYGESRVFDTGIREWTIIGQAMGMASRGLKPIAEIQYLDYVYYALAPLTDDLASLRWRSNNLQASPTIIRTRGHRLVGVWHAGSPMSALLGSLRGIWICVPRNMTQAAGFYNTLLQGDDPAIVVEVLNGYRLKERLPDNIGTFTVPLGVPEVLREGTDATIITYGACVRIAEEACDLLAEHGISVEIVDVQTLLPFDLPGTCVASVRKTNRVLFLDEDVPGGASAYMLQQVLEKQGGYRYLDAQPKTLAAKEHRPGYGRDGDYHSKPQVEDVVDVIFELIQE